MVVNLSSLLATLSVQLNWNARRLNWWYGYLCMEWTNQYKHWTRTKYAQRAGSGWRKNGTVVSDKQEKWYSHQEEKEREGEKMQEDNGPHRIIRVNHFYYDNIFVFVGIGDVWLEDCSRFRCNHVHQTNIFLLFRNIVIIVRYKCIWCS